MKIYNIHTIPAEVQNLSAMTNYTFRTNAYTDFRLLGDDKKAIEERFAELLDGWRKDIYLITELVMTLNWLMWFYADVDEDLARAYEKHWRKADAEVFKVFGKDEEKLGYFLRTTD